MSVQEACFVVPRLVRCERGETPEVILFLPHDWAQYGNLCYYTESGGHGEANYTYYAEHTMPGRVRPDLVAPVVRRYRSFLLSLGGDVRLGTKLPPDWRERAWGWSRQPAASLVNKGA